MKTIDKITVGKEEFSLCLAEISDCPLLAEAEAVCFASCPWSAKMFSEILEKEGCNIYCICDMQLSKILAYAVMYSCLDEADLANIATLPEIRKQGFGATLLDKALEISRSAGVLRTFLEVRESNTPARSLYLSRGFKEIGRRRNYYRDPREDAIIMSREEN